MAAFELTTAQADAVESVGRSVAVSAAAGSGKTSVLARRCAHLVCDADDDRRCDADALLVLTFTEAAAAEMRERITGTIRERADEAPTDARLRRQVALIGVARISTVHSFCAWIVRRWFNEAGVDPAFGQLDEAESAMLRREVLDEVFASLYAARPADTAADPLSPEADSEARWNPPLARGFVRLVDDYGLGRDEWIGDFVLKIAAFVESLPDPERWLDEAVASVRDRPESICTDRVAALQRELEWQREHAALVAAQIRTLDPFCAQYADRAEAHADVLGNFADQLQPTRDPQQGRDRKEAVDPNRDRKGVASSPDPIPGGATAARADEGDWRTAFESVRAAIMAYDVAGGRMSPLPRGSDEETKRDKDEAAALWNKTKGRFKDRIQSAFGRFSVEEWLDGLRRTAPYIETIVELVRAHRDAYAQRKARMGVLDFADLERFAFNVLHVENRIATSQRAGTPAPLSSHQRAGTPAPIPSAVAKTIQDRFAHVLVDEFQDINPLQAAILRLVSREADPEHDDNLFVVGDVKQSIYGFRLAEPAMFRERFDRFRNQPRSGHAIHLSENFRSRPRILEAVNAVFRAVMRRELGALEYDTDSELRRGRTGTPGEPQAAVEFHLLDREFGDADPDGDAPDEDAAGDDDAGASAEPLPGVCRGLDASKWSAIEREAHLIATRIRSLTGAGAPPVAFRDCAVLLRSAKVNAAQMAEMLNRMGVPAYAEASGSLLERMETRDLIAALHLLDNPMQDIPLASVLRSGIVFDPFTEDELLEIRCIDRDIPFHETVGKYAQAGADEALRDRITRFESAVARLREAARRRPLAEVIWRILHERDYLAYAGGLPGGTHRHANLIRMHDLARKFGTLRRQGLHRFLRFIESLADREETISAANAGGAAQDVVRVMTIHQSKGLEFPVVFVAGLGTRFNLSDRSGRMIRGRSTGIGLRVVDPTAMIEYPTAAHQRVADELDRDTRAEELRILYVAMTRAKDRLVLLGSMKGAEGAIDGLTGGGGPPSTLQLATAMTPLDWLVPAIGCTPAAQVARGGVGVTDATIFDVHVHGAAQMAEWRIEGGLSETRGDWRAAARLDPLPDDEPCGPDDPRVEEILERIEFQYPDLAVSSIRATVAASEFSGTHDYFNDPEIRRSAPASVAPFEIPPSRYAAPGVAMDAAARGTVTHRVLQHLDFHAADGEDGVASELQRMQGAGLLTAEELDVVDRDAIAWWLATPLAATIREAGPRFRREFLFVSAEPCRVFDATIDAADDHTVLVRGIVDGIIDGDEGLEILDYKTDAITEASLADRVEKYRPQLQLYGRAVERLWRKPVRRASLVFLTPRRVIEV